MQILRTEKNIGKKFVKPYWGSCHFIVLDIGFRFVFGQIYDVEEDRVVSMNMFEMGDSDWTEYVPALDFIKRLPTKNLN